MPESHKTQIIIAIIGLIGVIASAVIANYGGFFKDKHSDTPAPTYSPTPETNQLITIVAGKKMYFKQEAMTCRNLESIKNYSLYLASGKDRAIAKLIKDNLCGISMFPKVEVDIIMVVGHYVQIRAAYIDEIMEFWIRDDELY